MNRDRAADRLFKRPSLVQRAAATDVTSKSITETERGLLEAKRERLQKLRLESALPPADGDAFSPKRTRSGGANP